MTVPLQTSRLLHHDGSALHVSTQEPVLGEPVRLRLRVHEALGPVRRVLLRSNPDREPRHDEALPLPGAGDGWSWWQAETPVANPVHGYRWLVELADGTALWLNQAGAHRTEPRDHEDFRLVAHPAAPSWLTGSVLYQIFPDRFARSPRADEHPAPEWAIPAAWDDAVVGGQHPEVSYRFTGGDLWGAIERLDHLVALGVTLVYLTPFFPARSNHRYDASSFEVVDPLLGGDEALAAFVAAAHERGLRVIGDLTSNHSGDAHEWFRAAYGRPDAPEAGFYYWLNEEHTSYVSWLGYESLPKFDWSSPELRRRFIEGPDSVVAKWLRPPFSLDGWRIDVASMTGRWREIDLNEEVRRTIRRTMLEVNPDTVLIGEHTNDAGDDFQGDAWHGAMTYPAFTRPLWGWLGEPGHRVSGGIGLPLGTAPAIDGTEFLEQQLRFTASFPWRVRLGTMNALDTHDTARFAGIARPGTVPVAVGLAATLPGVAVVWAGDEFGLTGEDGEASRTPLPWSRLDAPEHAERIALYRELLALRRALPQLAAGGMRWLHADAESLLFVREDATGAVLVLAARAAAEAVLPLALLPTAAAAEPRFGTAELVVDQAVLRCTAEGPAFAVWSLPPTAIPA